MPWNSTCLEDHQKVSFTAFAKAAKDLFKWVGLGKLHNQKDFHADYEGRRGLEKPEEPIYFSVCG